MSEVRDTDGDRLVEILQDVTRQWSRAHFTDVQRGQIFRIYNDPTIDPTQEWTALSDVYPTSDGVNAIAVAPNLHA